MSATRVVKPNRDAERIVRCCATLIRAAHTVEELTEDQRDGWLTIGADARDSCDALRDQVASLERDLAELREAAREMREAFRAYDDAPHDERVANAGALYKRVSSAIDAMAALLPADPPKEASDHVFGVGDTVQRKPHGLPGGAPSGVDMMVSDVNDRVHIREASGAAWRVHPRDLVLVRKAKEASDGK